MTDDAVRKCETLFARFQKNGAFLQLNLTGISREVSDLELAGARFYEFRLRGKRPVMAGTDIGNYHLMTFRNVQLNSHTVGRSLVYIQKIGICPAVSPEDFIRKTPFAGKITLNLRYAFIIKNPVINKKFRIFHTAGDCAHPRAEIIESNPGRAKRRRIGWIKRENLPAAAPAGERRYIRKTVLAEQRAFEVWI